MPAMCPFTESSTTGTPLTMIVNFVPKAGDTFARRLGQPDGLREADWQEPAQGQCPAIGQNPIPEAHQRLLFSHLPAGYRMVTETFPAWVSGLIFGHRMNMSRLRLAGLYGQRQRQFFHKYIVGKVTDFPFAVSKTTTKANLDTQDELDW